ncbi:MAG: NAD-dependent epimerase/dehydratase family protein [Planctomycetota bacterium]
MSELPEHIETRLRASFEDETCVVTGGAGFIGSHVVETLLRLGASVRVIDDLSTSTLDTLGAMFLGAPQRLHFVRGSILDPSAVSEVMRGAKYVFHLAAVCSVPRSIEYPERTWAVNATGTLRVVRAAQASGAARVIYSASSSAYGNSPGLPKHEGDLPAPVSPYAASKLAGEHVIAASAETYGVSGVSLRYFNVFGPRQRPDTPYAGVVPAFASKLLQGEPPVVHGDGGQSRDFTYVDNVVFANALAAIADLPKPGAVLNVATEGRVSVLELAERLGSILASSGGQPLGVEHAPPRGGDVRHSQADISAARDILGYEPIVDFMSGLERTAAWHVDQRSGNGLDDEGDAGPGSAPDTSGDGGTR